MIGYKTIEDKPFQYSAYTGPPDHREKKRCDQNEHHTQKEQFNTRKISLMTHGMIFGDEDAIN